MTNIQSGDRVGVRMKGTGHMRTVFTVTDTHVTVAIEGRITEIPISELTSVVHTDIKAPTFDRPRRRRARDSNGRFNDRFVLDDFTKS